MAKQALNLGISANDGTGDTLRSGGDKINDNFNELYGSLGNGTALLDVVNNNLEIDVAGKANKISFLYDTEGDLPDATIYHGAIAHVHATGTLYYAHSGTWNKLLADTSGLGGVTNYTDPLESVAYAGTISSLIDVDLSTPATQNQVLTYNGSAWTAEDPTGGGASALEDLTNVSTNAPTTGQVLKWDGNQWAPAADITSGGAGLDADTLDGQDGSYYLSYNNFTGAATVTSLTMGGRTVNTISTDIASNRATALATEATVKAYVDANGGGGSIDPSSNIEVNTVTATSFINDGTGAPTITSGSNLTITAPGGVVVSDSISAGLFDITRSTETLLATSLSTTTNLDTQNSQIFYLTGAGSGLTATLNFQNVPTTNNKTISFAVVVDQQATPDDITTVQIDGSAQTVNWVGGSAPSGTASSKDVFNFTFIRTSNAWVVLGNLTSFS